MKASGRPEAFRFFGRGKDSLTRRLDIWAARIAEPPDFWAR